jgi:hypothetical protein
MSSATIVRAPEELRIDGAAPQANRIAGWFVLVGALLTALFAFWHHQRFWSAYLIAFTYVLSISLGGLFFVIVQHLTKAGWSVVVRRVAEGIAWNVRFLWIPALPLLVAIAFGYLQPQAEHGAYHAPADAAHGAAAGDHGAGHDGAAAGGEHGEAGHGDAAHGEAAGHGDHGHGDHNAWKEGPHMAGAAHHMQDAKAWWLSYPLVAGRLLLYMLIWTALAGFYFNTSVKQDATKDPALTEKMQKFAPPAVVLFALSTAMGSMDLLMALDPYWFSTIFGVYFFAGCFVSFNSALALTLVLLQRRGIITESVSAEHLHDVGKFMLAFIVFWAYIAFSQYMLIWYGNIPEETGWYLLRQSGDWTYVGLFLVVGHFVIPFLFMMSRFPKRRPVLLALGAVYILTVHWVDLFYIVQPQKSPMGHLPVPLLDIFLTLAFVGVYVAITVVTLRGVNLIPVGDPRLGESLAHENY